MEQLKCKAYSCFGKITSKSSSTFTLLFSWVLIFARWSMYTVSLVSDTKNSPERRHIMIDYWCSKRPSVPCRHPSNLRECESTVSYHTTFRREQFEGRWPWRRFRSVKQVWTKRRPYVLPKNTSRKSSARIPLFSWILILAYNRENWL